MTASNPEGGGRGGWLWLVLLTAPVLAFFWFVLETILALRRL
jgi:hypothetical protein